MRSLNAIAWANIARRGLVTAAVLLIPAAAMAGEPKQADTRAAAAKAGRLQTASRVIDPTSTVRRFRKPFTLLDGPLGGAK